MNRGLLDSVIEAHWANEKITMIIIVFKWDY